MLSRSCSGTDLFIVVAFLLSGWVGRHWIGYINLVALEEFICILATTPFLCLVDNQANVRKSVGLAGWLAGFSRLGFYVWRISLLIISH